MMHWDTDDIRKLDIAGVTEADLETIRELLIVWRNRHRKNVRRSLYFDSEQAFKDLGIAMPPQLRNCGYVLGWSTQAVTKPARRTQFDGLRLPGQDDPFELGSILDANDFGLEFGESVESAYKHGFSLVTVASGDRGEAPAQIISHSAESSSALWDRRTRSLSSALTISTTDKDGKPTGFVVYLSDKVIECTFTKGVGWTSETSVNRTGEVLAVPVRNNPNLTNPLGRSRLTNSVMQLNDMAVRTLGRMEANAEFYSSPQIALMGVDYEAFYGDNPVTESEKFKLAMDRLIAVSKDEDGDRPVLQQLQQASMTPHSDMMRTIAMAFSGETSIPPSSLGVIHDQPASAEAIRAAEHDMLIDASYHNKYVHPKSVKDIMRLALLVRDGSVPEDFWKMSVKFVDPEFRSMSAQADAVTKLSTQMDTLSSQPVLLEKVFTEDEVERIQSDARRSSGQSLLRQLVETNTARVRETANVSRETGEEALTDAES